MLGIEIVIFFYQTKCEREKLQNKRIFIFAFKTKFLKTHFKSLNCKFMLVKFSVFVYLQICIWKILEGIMEQLWK